MTKLKTLKDLERDYGHSGVHFFGYDAEELKLEAIKWINHLESTYDYSIKTEDTYSGTALKDNDNVINWIKHFFNLTGEDLR